MRELTIIEVEVLASRVGVNYIAASNFLNSLCNNDGITSARANLRLDSRLYRWNFLTHRAISDGITLSEAN